MNPPDEVKRRLLRQWLGRAEKDWEAAAHLASSSPRYREIAAFHAQQAAEKYLKAFLVQRQIEFPKTRDLEELLNLVRSANPQLSESLREAIILTRYSVEIRYPGFGPEMTEEEARQALELASRVREAIISELKPEVDEMDFSS